MKNLTNLKSHYILLISIILHYKFTKIINLVYIFFFNILFVIYLCRFSQKLSVRQNTFFHFNIYFVYF